ncbi:uncharacterized protein LOC144344258 [Saccoglossus kowalevskii]
MKQWPELVGKTVEEATVKIKEDCPDVQVQVIPHDSMVTMDFREDRVRIFVENQKVQRPPRIG